MKVLIIFSIIVLINSVHGNVARSSCTLRNGGQGLCMPIKDCDMCKYPNFAYFPDHFCPGDFSLICCDPSISAPSRVDVTTTTKAPPPPPLNIRSFENHPSYKLFDMENCGELRSNVKISQGEVAQVLEFPWAVLIGYDVGGETKFLCGGTLISSELKNF